MDCAEDARRRRMEEIEQAIQQLQAEYKILQQPQHLAHNDTNQVRAAAARIEIQVFFAEFLVPTIAARRSETLAKAGLRVETSAQRIVIEGATSGEVSGLEKKVRKSITDRLAGLIRKLVKKQFREIKDITEDKIRVHPTPGALFTLWSELRNQTRLTELTILEITLWKHWEDKCIQKQQMQKPQKKQRKNDKTVPFWHICISFADATLREKCNPYSCTYCTSPVGESPMWSLSIADFKQELDTLDAELPQQYHERNHHKHKLLDITVPQTQPTEPCPKRQRTEPVPMVHNDLAHATVVPTGGFPVTVNPCAFRAIPPCYPAPVPPPCRCCCVQRQPCMAIPVPRNPHAYMPPGPAPLPPPPPAREPVRDSTSPSQYLLDTTTTTTTTTTNETNTNFAEAVTHAPIFVDSNVLTTEHSEANSCEPSDCTELSPFTFLPPPDFNFTDVSGMFNLFANQEENTE